MRALGGPAQFTEPDGIVQRLEVEQASNSVTERTADASARRQMTRVPQLHLLIELLPRMRHQPMVEFGNSQVRNGTGLEIRFIESRRLGSRTTNLRPKSVQMIETK